MRACARAGSRHRPGPTHRPLPVILNCLAGLMYDTFVERTPTNPSRVGCRVSCPVTVGWFLTSLAVRRRKMSPGGVNDLATPARYRYCYPHCCGRPFRGRMSYSLGCLVSTVPMLLSSHTSGALLTRNAEPNHTRCCFTRNARRSANPCYTWK